MSKGSLGLWGQSGRVSASFRAILPIRRLGRGRNAQALRTYPPLPKFSLRWGMAWAGKLSPAMKELAAS